MMAASDHHRAHHQGRPDPGAASFYWCTAQRLSLHNHGPSPGKLGCAIVGFAAVRLVYVLEWRLWSLTVLRPMIVILARGGYSTIRVSRTGEILRL